MGNIKDWVKDLNYNKETAQKYKGVKTVKDILKLAKEDGYDFKEKELLKLNLSLIAGGSDFFDEDWSLFNFGDKKTNINQKTNNNEVNTFQNAEVNGDKNYISMGVNNTSNQS